MDCCCGVSRNLESFILEKIKSLRISKSVDIFIMNSIIQSLDFFDNDYDFTNLLKITGNQLSDKVNRNFINSKKQILREKFFNIYNNLIPNSDNKNKLEKDTDHIFENNLIQKILESSEYRKHIFLLFIFPFLNWSEKEEGDGLKEKINEFCKVFLKINDEKYEKQIDIYPESMEMNLSDFREILIKYTFNYLNNIYTSFTVLNNDDSSLAEDVQNKFKNVFVEENIEKFIDDELSAFSIEFLNIDLNLKSKDERGNRFNTMDSRKIRNRSSSIDKIKFNVRNKSSEKKNILEMKNKESFSNKFFSFSDMQNFFTKNKYFMQKSEFLDQIVYHFERKIGIVL